MGDLAKLQGLGAKSEQMLQVVGINTESELRELGAVAAFARVQNQLGGVSLNLLYALVGALENRDWREVAQNDKAELLMQLDGYQRLNAL